MSWKIAGWAGLLAFALIVGTGIVGPMLVGGQRVSGTMDEGAIRAYYAHDALAWLPALEFATGPLILMLACGMRASLPRDDTASPVGFAAMVAAVPGYLLSAALGSALATLATSGAPLLPTFRLWDVFYNSAMYTLEAAYMVAFGLALLRSGAPRWLAWLGVGGGLVQAFNASALWIHAPDTATLPGNVAILVWLAGISVWLVRGAPTARAASAASVTARA